MEENISDLLENPEDPVPEKCKEKKKQRRSKKSVVVEEENIVEENIMEDDIPDLLENNPEHPVPEKCQEKKKRGRSKKSIVVEDLNIVEENIMEDDISDSLANNLGDPVTEKGQGKKKQGRSKKSVVVENENVVKENIMEDDIPDLLGNNPGDPVPEKDQGKKKRGRSTKKSVVVEDEKRVKFLSKLLNCDGMPSHTVEVLKLEEQEKGHLYKLNSLEMEKLWNDLRDPVKTRLNNLMCPEVEQFKEESREVLSAIISLLLHTTALHDVADSEALAWIAVAFNLVLIEKNTGQQLKSKISELCEYCCIKGIRVDGSFYLNTINFLLDLTVDDKNGVDRKPEIKRMWEMRVALARLNLRTQSCESVVARLEKIVASPTYLACKEGRQFIAFTLTLDIKLIKRLHKAIKDFLSICKRTQACAYGEVYYSAWFNGSSEVRQELEKHCIQNLMTHMFVFKRHKQELVHTGQNVFAILSYLHHHRTTAQFSKVLTELYMPLLWRHLRSGNNIERSNAALVFLDVYPLEMPGSGRADESDFCIKQHNEMVDLLTDTCHVVRMIAIRGICSKLCSAWRTFPQETIQVLMRNLIELSNDASDYKVRVTLYDSLRDLLLNPESAAYLMRILPKLRDNIHDENEKVRKSFVKLLLSVKTQTSETRVPYWKIVPIDHLAARLQLEKAEVGSLLCKLLMSNIYSPDHSADVFLFRIIRFIDTNPAAARNLFQFSMKVLEYKDAVRIMLTILLNLRAYVKKKLEESNVSNVPEEQENKSSGSSSGGRRRKKRKSLEHLQTICENEQDELEETDKENSSQLSNTNSSADSSKEEDEFGRPGVFHALVDIVSLLWSMHSNKLADPERHKDHEDLMDCAVAGIPLFLRYYKGSPTYFAVIQLASLVPPNRLIASSTVCSACAASLKAVSEMTPQGEIEVLINALCSWNRFVDIQDIVVDWLDQAFRCEGLNQSNNPTLEHKQRKVRFIAKGGKPMLALRLLDAVFFHPLNKKRVLGKAYNQVYELFMYLERIKTLVDRRLLGGLPLDSAMLGDDFLLKCFLRYAKLILILHRPEPQSASDSRSIVDPFDAGEVFQQLIQWATISVRTMLPQRLEDEPDISVLLMKDLLCVAANLVDLNYAGKTTIVKLAALIKDILSSECSLWYVEPSMIVVKHMKDYCEAFYGPQDQDQLLRTVVPSLLSQAMRSLSENKYTKEEVVQCVENMYELKTSMYEVVNCLQKLFGPKSHLVQSVLKLFTDALVSIISTDIKQLQILDTVDKVQELPFVCGILLSIVSRANIAPLWIATIPSSISQLYSQDADLLAAAVSLLHTLAHCGLSLPKQELCLAVREAHSAVTSYNRESTATRPRDSSVLIAREFTLPLDTEAKESLASQAKESLASQRKESQASQAKESLPSRTKESLPIESRESVASTSVFNESSFSDHSIDIKKVGPPILSELAAFLNTTLI